MKREFQRVAIVNRGEPAMRFIHAAREFNQERGTQIRTIALYTEPDRNSMFVREADESFFLGPAQTTDENGRRKHCYLDYGTLERALVSSRADAVWVGWGFVAEQADFVDLCDRLDIVFIGPSADVMRRLGDKISSKLLAEKADVPIAAWSGGPVDTLEAAYHQAERLGYPLMIKATAGGGGRGIRKAITDADLAEAFESARSEGLNSFGDAAVFMEQLINNARHIEVQIIGDHYGTVWAVGVRDCSIQRRHQKVIEESSSTVLSSDQEMMLREAAIRLGMTVGYQNAGTVEFLYDVDKKRFSFMEVNARLQVEHPVTEITTGLDLVKLQLHVAMGGRLEGKPPKTTGHAVEARLNAEDPDNNFAPSPGRVELFDLPTGPGLRIDAGVTEGDEIAPQFDSMIAKIIAYGASRLEAVSRLKRALKECKVAVQGGRTNKTFLLELLDHPDFITGRFDNNWLDRLMIEGKRAYRPFADIALLQAAINVYEDALEIEQAQFYSSAARGRPGVRSEVGLKVELNYRGQTYKAIVYRIGSREYRIDIEGRRVCVHIDCRSKFEKRLTIADPHCGTGIRSFRNLSVVDGVMHLIEVEGLSHSISNEESGIVRTPSPAIVVSISVKEGDEVRVGDRLAILEAMKMEMTVTAPYSGKVKRILVSSNVQVSAGAPLINIDPNPQETGVGETERIRFETVDETMKGFEQTAKENKNAFALLYCSKLECLRRFLLGFDFEYSEAKRLLADILILSKETQNYDQATAADLLRREDELIQIFLDLNSLFRRNPLNDDSDIDEILVSDEYFVVYLKTLDSRAAGMPASFYDKLGKMTSHYDGASLERSPELTECMLWIYKAWQRNEELAEVVQSVLERRLERIVKPVVQPGKEFRDLIDSLIRVSQRQIPSLHEIARELQYHYFEEPIFEQSRNKIYQQAEEDLNYLLSYPSAYDREERMNALINCPQPLVNFCLSRFGSVDMSARMLMMEIITRRYYRMRYLENPKSIVIDERGYTQTEYMHEGKRIHLVTTYAEHPELKQAVESINRVIEDVPPDHDVMIDFYIRQHGVLKEIDATQEELHKIFNEAKFVRPIRRIVAVAACVECGYGMKSLQHFTYRPVFEKRDSEEKEIVVGYAEEKVYRNLHPMMGKRLHLWRLSNFDIERLPSAEDVYLFYGKAYANPKDERLFALAEVRDITPVRDENGRVVQLPHLERMLLQALSDIRINQFRRAPHEKLHWNRLLLYVWPPMDLKPEEFEKIVHRVAPATEGLGLEQVAVRAQVVDQSTRELIDLVMRVSNPAGKGILISYTPVPDEPIEPITEYEQKVVRLLQRGMIYPYELIKMLTPSIDDGSQSDFPYGDFTEYDLDEENRLVPVERPYGMNKVNIIVGVIRNYTKKYPKGMKRVVLLGDPSREMGSLAEAECKRILAAIDLAECLKSPLEWFAVSAGAKISMESGTENMDWIALVLRRLIDFTQSGGEVNVIVNGINVGAQPYWNAESTMLMHTRGILIMTGDGAMVLTGKQALDYSGSVSAEDNFGIGGYERTMGTNGQAQYFARDISEACRILLCHYDHTYVIPGERFPRRAETKDPLDRNACRYPHGEGFVTVGDIFSDETNKGRKKMFQIRKVMRAVTDQDHPVLERWQDMRDAETGVVWDAHIGGYPVCLLGFESHSISRLGFVPADGPENWTSGTLFPQSSKKIARAINSATANRPVVVLANLAGFDGSPESMRKIQLEYGAEIGRAVVNFKGPIIFCVISRYHGGAFVVFSRRLNDNMEVAALEGTYASVIGGAPAAAVVFAREVDNRTRKDSRIQSLEKEIAKAEDSAKRRLRIQIKELYKQIRSEKLGEVADEFDATHSVHRALKVGSLDKIISPDQLRPYLIDAIERGIKREMEK